MQRGDVRRPFAEFNMFCICPAAAFKAAPGRFFKLRCRRLFQAALPLSGQMLSFGFAEFFRFFDLQQNAVKCQPRFVLGMSRLRYRFVEHPPIVALISYAPLSYVLPKVHFFAFAAIYQRLQSGFGAFISKSPKKPRTSNPARSSSARSFFSV